MMIDDPARETAEELAATWINGNRSDVRAHLADLEPLAAAALALAVRDFIEETDSTRAARDFVDAVDTWAEEEFSG